jgi:hypothetical protein
MRSRKRDGITVPCDTALLRVSLENIARLGGSIGRSGGDFGRVEFRLLPLHGSLPPENHLC